VYVAQANNVAKDMATEIYGIDISNTIWIFITECGSIKICRFYDEHFAGRSNEKRKKAPYTTLRSQVLQIVRESFKVGRPVI
jgi:hypothetical protein